MNIYCYEVFNEEIRLKFDNSNLELYVGSKPYYFLSGGERQRIDFLFVFAIKIALSNFTNKCTNLLILDEGLNSQDTYAYENFIELIDKLIKDTNITFILVSHNYVNVNINKLTISRFKNKTELEVQINN